MSRLRRATERVEMRESEYIIVGNLTKAQIANRILRDMLIDDDTPAWHLRAKALIAIEELTQGYYSRVRNMEEG